MSLRAVIEELKEIIYSRGQVWTEVVGFWGSQPYEETFWDPQSDEDAEALDLLEEAEKFLKEGKEQEARSLVEQAEELICWGSPASSLSEEEEVESEKKEAELERLIDEIEF